jgi:hypothetical protein
VYALQETCLHRLTSIYLMEDTCGNCTAGGSFSSLKILQSIEFLLHIFADFHVLSKFAGTRSSVFFCLPLLQCYRELACTD